MGKEIERKFLLNREKWLAIDKPTGQHFRQGYILTDPNKTIRVRTTETKGFLTIKGISVGASRSEYEYEIPLHEASELLDNFATSELEKIRYVITYKEKVWEIDEFLGDNFGLMVAEIELISEDEEFDLPEWIDQEVTEDQKYYNSNLTLNPYKLWAD
ncbi:CYTH domain-containing protein [Pedobacter paludis]|uniref:Adenylate cyclase n=1 Tax=Pedobacter paludis TaxID=2203212 RepID=A0A317F0Y7_9SPHI|nr:CYTH domain-containing protein [Pedobacter paludis]PWS31913.1 adenylate cyclase [Pedobacter paludis]